MQNNVLVYLDFRLGKLKNCKCLSELDFMWGSLLGAVNLAFNVGMITEKERFDYEEKSRAIYNSKLNGCMKGGKNEKAG